ncbi:uncharacterized protein V1516DRAFT_608658, partial [Lipomyces oligophaga]|uniref:uncharacterized protein n=1 Tax=Lipomyces oligophaga TaxID=45792 RepID=UPI0034CE5BF5
SSSDDDSILPFDTPLGQNFTEDSCPTFFKSFINEDEFIDCQPLSFLLQSSQSWFKLLKQGVYKISSALDDVCAVNVDTCATLMDRLAVELVSSDNCQADLNLQNPLVTSAYNSFTSYRMLYSAGCIQSSSGAYCYVEAVSNSTNSGDLALYFLPLDVSLPVNSSLSCNSCTENTLSVYYNYAGNTSLALSNTYVSAAKALDSQCGSSAAQTSV